MASGDRYNDGSSKAQTGYETTNTVGNGGGNKAQNVATQDNDLSQQILGVANRLQRKYGSKSWFNAAVNQIVPLFDEIDQSNGDLSIMKTRQTSQGSQSR